VAIFWIIPMLWAVDTAFKPETETTTIPVSWFPTHFTLQAFQEVLQAGDLPRWYLNSIPHIGDHHRAHGPAIQHGGLRLLAHPLSR